MRYFPSSYREFYYRPDQTSKLKIFCHFLIQEMTVEPNKIDSDAPLSNSEFLEYIPDEKRLEHLTGPERTFRDQKNLQAFQKIILNNWREKVQHTQEIGKFSVCIFTYENNRRDEKWQKFYLETLHSDKQFLQLRKNLQDAVAPFQLCLDTGGVFGEQIIHSYRAGIHVYISWVNPVETSCCTLQ
jgi:hypothetical protein